MIEQNTIPFNTYNGDIEAAPALKIFAAQFPTFEIESLVVFVTEIATEIETVLVVDVDFTAANLGLNGINGSITLLDSAGAWLNPINKGLAAAYTITLEFSDEAFQPAGFRDLTTFSPVSLETTTDRLTMVIKALKARIDELTPNGQIQQNEDDIAQLQIDLDAAEADLVALTARVTAIENDTKSTKEAVGIGPAGNISLLATINESTHDNMVFEYIVVRGGTFQYGRELILNNSPFAMFQLEKISDAGFTFSITEAAGIGTVKYTSTAGVAGFIWFRLYKFAV